MRMFLLLALFSLVAVGAEVKISQLPLGSASTSGGNSAFPFYDSTDIVTKKLKLSDVPNIPALAANSWTVGKLLAGYSSTTGVLSSSDSIVSAISKLNGNVNAISAAAISIGTYDSQAPAANAAVLALNVLYLQSADATHPGMVNTGVQTFAGVKTFSSTISASINGNAATATALAANPTDCAVAGTFANAIDAQGNLTCATPAGSSFTVAPFNVVTSNDGLTIQGAQIFAQAATATIPGMVSNSSQTFSGTKTFNSTISGSINGNAATSTALAANPTDCAAGSFANSIDAQGNLTCSTPAGTGVSSVGPFNVVTSNDGLTIQGTQLFAQSATATIPGMVSNSSQTFSGAKTFNSVPSVGTMVVSDSSSSAASTSFVNQILYQAQLQGALSLATFGSSPNSKGASLANSSLTLQPADASNPGGVSTTTQTFAGNKTFSGNATIQGTTTIATAITGLVKATAGVLSQATSGTDYQAAISSQSQPSNGFVASFTAPGTFNFGTVIQGSGIVIVSSGASIVVRNSGGRTINTQSGTNYTIVLPDGGNYGGNPLIHFTSASAVAVNIPTNNVVPFAIGDQVDACQLGAGKVTFAGSSGVTLSSKSSNKSIGAQYVCVSLVKSATDTWTLIGDLIAGILNFLGFRMYA